MFERWCCLSLLITISLHIVTMLNEIDNIFGLDTILNGEPIGLGNQVSRQCGSNIGESNSRGDNKL
jgi:hypothetical protein